MDKFLGKHRHISLNVNHNLNNLLTAPKKFFKNKFTDPYDLMREFYQNFKNLASVLCNLFQSTEEKEYSLLRTEH